MTIDQQLEAAGLVTVSERMLCNGPMDGFARHASVDTLEDFVKWLEMERRSNMEMVARHDLGIHELCDDVADFVYGKSATLWEVHVNLLHAMRDRSND